MTDCEYIVDNNTLEQLTPEQQSSALFCAHAHIPSEVLYEARNLPDIERLKQNECPMTVEILSALVEVMASIPTDDTRLVNLYTNHGNADPIIVAFALAGQRSEDACLFGPKWVIVSDDRAVRTKATEFAIEVLTNKQFAEIISQSLN